jgi:hypothetical protein
MSDLSGLPTGAKTLKSGDPQCTLEQNMSGLSLGGSSRPEQPGSPLVQKATGVSSSNNKRDRRDLLYLFKNMDEVIRSKILLSTKKYIPRSTRDLITRILLFYHRHHQGTNIYDHVENELLDVLAESTKRALDKEIRNKMHDCISRVCTQFASEIAEFRLENDDERFDIMTDAANITPKYWFQLCEMGVINCRALLHSRKFILVGVKDAETFFSEVKRRWQFEEPANYFSYAGGASIPAGKIESATHVMHGRKLT